MNIKELKSVKTISTEERLSNEHWVYVKALLLTHNCSKENVDKIEFHYKTAFIHGYKHGINAKSAMLCVAKGKNERVTRST